MIDTEKINDDLTIITLPLAISLTPSSSYSIHNISIMQPNDPDKTEYLIFEYISGTSVMNWTREHYAVANTFFNIGNREIVISSDGRYTNIPDSYRR